MPVLKLAYHFHVTTMVTKNIVLNYNRILFPSFLIKIVHI